MSCCNTSNADLICKPLKTTSVGKYLVVSDTRHCIRNIENPVNQSLVLYDENGQVVWADGSSTFPICLPELQQNSDPVTFLLGMTSSGCIVKVPITYEDIVTCQGVTITTPALAVT